jgi:hypothetical protein
MKSRPGCKSFLTSKTGKTSPNHEKSSEEKNKKPSHNKKSGEFQWGTRN